MKSCLEQHSICKANCCRSILINTNQRINSKSKKISMRMNLTKDLAWYFKLRGATYKHGILTYDLNNYRVEEIPKAIILHRDCELLDGFLCKGHPNDKPELCKELDVNDASTVKDKFYITTGCLLDK